MFPVSNTNLIQVSVSPVVTSIQGQMFGSSLSSPDPHLSFNSQRPPNVGPILGPQVSLPPPSLAVAPQIRLFNAPPPTVQTIPPPGIPQVPVSGIPWGAGALQGFPARPSVPPPPVGPQIPHLQPGIIPHQPNTVQQLTNTANQARQLPIQPNSARQHLIQPNQIQRLPIQQNPSQNLPNMQNPVQQMLNQSSHVQHVLSQPSPAQQVLSQPGRTHPMLNQPKAVHHLQNQSNIAQQLPRQPTSIQRPSIHPNLIVQKQPPSSLKYGHPQNANPRMPCPKASTISPNIDGKKIVPTTNDETFKEKPNDRRKRSRWDGNERDGIQNTNKDKPVTDDLVENKVDQWRDNYLKDRDRHRDRHRNERAQCENYGETSEDRLLRSNSSGTFEKNIFDPQSSYDYNGADGFNDQTADKRHQRDKKEKGPEGHREHHHKIHKHHHHHHKHKHHGTRDSEARSEGSRSTGPSERDGGERVGRDRETKVRLEQHSDYTREDSRQRRQFNELISGYDCVDLDRNYPRDRDGVNRESNMRDSYNLGFRNEEDYSKSKREREHSGTDRDRKGLNIGGRERGHSRDIRGHHKGSRENGHLQERRDHQSRGRDKDQSPHRALLLEDRSDEELGRGNENNVWDRTSKSAQRRNESVISTEMTRRGTVLIEDRDKDERYTNTYDSREGYKPRDGYDPRNKVHSEGRFDSRDKFNSLDRLNSRERFNSRDRYDSRDRVLDRYEKRRRVAGDYRHSSSEIGDNGRSKGVSDSRRSPGEISDSSVEREDISYRRSRGEISDDSRGRGGGEYRRSPGEISDSFSDEYGNDYCGRPDSYSKNIQSGWSGAILLEDREINRPIYRDDRTRRETVLIEDGIQYSNEKDSHSNDRKRYGREKDSYNMDRHNLHDRDSHHRVKKHQSYDQNIYSMGKEHQNLERDTHSKDRKHHSNEREVHSKDRKYNRLERGIHSMERNDHIHDREAHIRDKKHHGHEKESHSMERKHSSQERDEPDRKYHGQKTDKKHHSHEREIHSMDRAVNNQGHSSQRRGYVSEDNLRKRSNSEYHGDSWKNKHFVAHKMNDRRISKGHVDKGQGLVDGRNVELSRDKGHSGSDRNHQPREIRDRRERSLLSQRSFGSGVKKRSWLDSNNENLMLDEPPRFKRQRIEEQIEDSQVQCVRSGAPILPDEETGELDAESVAAWVRCSAADLYFRKDPKTGNLETTKRMQDLEKKFEYSLVQRAARIKATQVPYEKPVRKPKLNFGHSHQHDHGKKCCKQDLSDTDSDTDSDEDDEEEVWWMEELRYKQGHPYKLHKELWYNEPGELNYGPLCRCSVKAKKTGIRHNIYPGEKPLPKCSKTSNNIDKLFHYKITVSPVTNFLTKHPTIINFDGHEYMFEGFSLFSHKPIPKLPPCQTIRFNIIYTIHIIEEQAPENFSVESLDLFAKFLFDEILELVDIDWKGPGEDEHCRRFHIMPRFSRPFPENGKEVLSMNDVFLYLLRASKPVIDPMELSSLIKFDATSWQHFVDGFRHMVVTCPGKRPSSIRIDQLDKQHCDIEDRIMFPLIIHHGNRPPQISYVGDNNYRKKWKEYLKFRHLLWTRTKVTPKDKDKLEELESELQKIRSKCSMKREVTMEIDSEGFLLTGIRSDICQHAMMLPVLFNHVRFHECLFELETRIGYSFKDRSLLQLALTHASYKVNYGTNPDHGRNALYNCGSRHVEMGDMKVQKHTRKRGLNVLLKIMSKLAKKEEERSEIPHNERLEFLGDAVVEFISSIHLFYMFPYADEGELTVYRGALVQNAHFAVLAEKLGLHEYLLFSHGPDLCMDGDLKHAMANCFEALMGALYLDGGMNVADRVFATALYDEEDLLDIWTNLPKHPLQIEEPNGDRHWIENSPALKKLIGFEEDIGYEFYNIRLLAKAFSQRSVGYNRLTHGHNQRLEFLGDTVMQLISSDYLFRHFPDHHEGHLTLLRSSLVNNKTQAHVADELGMENFVLRGKNEELNQPILKHKEKADLLESLLGAIYVDGGLDPCTTLCSVCFFPRLEMFIMNQDWNDPKSQLQQSCLTLRDTKEAYPDIPVYKVLSQSGPTNTRTFKVAVYFRGKRLAVGEGRSIQQGEMKAAETALHDNNGLFNSKLRSRMGIK